MASRVGSGREVIKAHVRRSVRVISDPTDPTRRNPTLAEQSRAEPSREKPSREKP